MFFNDGVETNCENFLFPAHDPTDDEAIGPSNITFFRSSSPEIFVQFKTSTSIDKTRFGFTLLYRSCANAAPFVDCLNAFKKTLNDLTGAENRREGTFTHQEFLFNTGKDAGTLACPAIDFSHVPLRDFIPQVFLNCDAGSGGCICLPNSVCTSDVQTCVNGVCLGGVCPKGSEGCLCENSENCNENLVCNAQIRCVKEEQIDQTGCLGCLCGQGSKCDGKLQCDGQDTCVACAGFQFLTFYFPLLFLSFIFVLFWSPVLTYSP